MFRFKKKIIYSPTIDSEVVSKLPLTFFEGKITVIDAPGPEFDKAVKYLSRRRVIGFDTETRPVFTPHAPQNGVALLQLSSGRRAYLFRVYRMGLDDALSAILASPKIIKVGAAVHDDIRGLQKIYPFEAAGFVDLQKICGQWGITDKSVKKLCAIVMGRRISKTQQLSNWEAPRLSDAQKIYAATDAWICREMYFRLLDTEKIEPSSKDIEPEVVSSPAANVQSDSDTDTNASKASSNEPAKKRRKRNRKPKID